MTWRFFFACHTVLYLIVIGLAPCLLSAQDDVLGVEQPDPGEETAMIEIVVEDDLLHRLTGKHSKGLGEKRTYVAADGEYLGVAAKGSEPHVSILLLEGDRLGKPLILQPPLTEPFHFFGFAMAEGGELCILNGLDQQLVFRKQELVATLSLASRMADIRDDELLWSLQADIPPPSIPVEEDPQLLVISDLSERELREEDCEALLSVDLREIDRNDEFAVLRRETFACFRKDGKIWAVSIFSGRIQLLSRSGRVLLEKQLDEYTEPVDQEALHQQVLAATGKPLHNPEPDIVVAVPSKRPVVRSIAAYRNDLLLRPTRYSKYSDLLIMYDSQLDRFYHFVLPEALSEARYIAATEDAVWFNKPVSRIEIDDLMAMVWAEVDTRPRTDIGAKWSHPAQPQIAEMKK